MDREDEKQPLLEPTFASGTESKFKFWKDLLCLCLGFHLIFIGFFSLQNLESSLNSDAGLGVVSMACIYAGTALAGFIAPIAIQYVGCKWCIVVSFIAQAIYLASNGLPRFYTMIPSSVLIGVLFAPMYTGQGIYLTILSAGYADYIQVNMNQIINQFNGIFFTFFQGAQVFGNLISSLILNHGNTTAPENATCGYHFCDIDIEPSNVTSAEPTTSKTLVYLLLGVYIALDVLAIIIVLCFVSNRALPEAMRNKKASEQILSTVLFHLKPECLLLLPLFTYNGVELGFMVSEYTKAYPGCALGVSHIGYTMLGSGITTAIFSFLVGRVEKYVGRIFLFSLAITINISILTLLMFWVPPPDMSVIYFIIPALWGVADSVWQTITCALLGILFYDQMEPAFATFRTWQALGFVIIMASSHFICMDIKIYMTLGLGITGIVLFYTLEVYIRVYKHYNRILEVPVDE